MKTKLTTTLIISLCLLLLASCGCKHETWLAADCENAKRCAACEETEGAPLGHTWLAATCTTPKTCEVCAKTDGQANGHSWQDATCEEPRTCSACKLEEGDALGHTWVEATTEAPKTCTVCSLTEGEAIITDPRFTTAACQAVFGTWYSEHVFDGASELGIDSENLAGEDLTYTAYMTYTFYNDGLVKASVTFDEASYFRALRILTIEITYLAMEQAGVSRADADAIMLSEVGVDVPGYVDLTMEQMDIHDFDQELEGVYYISGDTLYIGNDWEDSNMTPHTWELEGGKLTLTDHTTSQTVEFIKQAE